MIGQSVAPSQPYRPRVVTPDITDAAISLVNLSRSKSGEDTDNQASMLVPQDGLQTLINSQPPFVGRLEKRPSTPFLTNLFNTLRRVPQALCQGISDWGYKIVTATQTSNIFPEDRPQELQALRTKIIPNTEKDKTAVVAKMRRINWWLTATSISSKYPKTIFMPEVGARPEAEFEPVPGQPDFLRVKQLEIFPVLPVSQEYTLLHEFGHAVDDYMGHFPLKPEHTALRLSTTNAFKDAYFADVKTIQDASAKQKLAYYLPRSYDPEDISLRARAEAFADAFASVLLVDEKDQIPANILEKRQFFIKHFPKTCEFVSSEVVKPYQQRQEDDDLGELTDGESYTLQNRKRTFEADHNEALRVLQQPLKKPEALRKSLI